MLESTDEEFSWEDEDSTNNYDSESGVELARSNNLQNSTSLKKKNEHEGIKMNIAEVAAGIKELKAFRNGEGTHKNVELHGSKRLENSGSQKDQKSLKALRSFDSIKAYLSPSKSQKGLAGESQNSPKMKGSSTGSPTNSEPRIQHSGSQNGKSEHEKRKIEEINDAIEKFEEYLTAKKNFDIYKDIKNRNEKLPSKHKINYMPEWDQNKTCKTIRGMIDESEYGEDEEKTSQLIEYLNKMIATPQIMEASDIKTSIGIVGKNRGNMTQSIYDEAYIKSVLHDIQVRDHKNIGEKGDKEEFGEKKKVEETKIDDKTLEELLNEKVQETYGEELPMEDHERWNHMLDICIKYRNVKKLLEEPLKKNLETLLNFIEYYNNIVNEFANFIETEVKTKLPDITQYKKLRLYRGMNDAVEMLYKNSYRLALSSEKTLKGFGDNYEKVEQLKIEIDKRIASISTLIQKGVALALEGLQRGAAALAALERLQIPTLPVGFFRPSKSKLIRI
uniref:Uncharacterized protein n=1 Tax=Meloidogyne javanica TaxID=6303 RepID=A0A915LUK2_MELJA